MEGRHKEATDAQSAVGADLGARKFELASLEQASAVAAARIQDLERPPGVYFHLHPPPEHQADLGSLFLYMYLFELVWYPNLMC